MKKYIIKDYKIIGQADNDYMPKDDEIIISANDIDYPILKRTGGQFFEINRDNKQSGDIEVGCVTKFKVKRNNQIVIIERSEKLTTDELLEFVQPPDMIRVYRGGTSVLTIGTDFDHATEDIEHTYTKDELYILNGKAQVKTPEMQIVDIRNKARVKLLEMENIITDEEKRKTSLIAIDDWTIDDETKLTEMKANYQTAIDDYNNVKTILLNGATSLESITLAKQEVKPLLEKYKIKI
jgi:hypothetical protein